MAAANLSGDRPTGAAVVMTGGLRALVAATRSATPRLRPRPVSRFESIGRPLADTEFAPISEFEQPADARTSPVEARAARVASKPVRTRELDAPRDTVTAPQGVDHPPRTTESREARQPESREARQPTTPRGVDHPARTTESREARQPTTPSPALAVAHPRPIGAPATSPAPAPAQHRHPSPHPPAPVRDQPTPPPAEHRSVTEATPARPDPIPRPARAANPQGGALVPPPIPNIAATSHARAAESPFHPDTTGSAPLHRTEPDVHVSIGRIDVRATPVPVSAPTHAGTPERSTVMGLDDYLGQQGRR